MSCPQQLKESNDIIESFKKQLTTFAKNIKPDYYNTIPKENINIYQCATLLTTAMSLLVITILSPQLYKIKNVTIKDITKNVTIKDITKNVTIENFKKEDLEIIVLPLVVGGLLILYSFFLHYSRKNMFEGLDEEENKTFETIFHATFIVNILVIICLIFGTGVWVKKEFIGKKLYENISKSDIMYYTVFGFIGILLIFGMIMSFILWPEKKDEIDKRTEVKKNEKQIKNVTKENFLSSESKWVEIANNNCSLKGWTEVFYNPKETYIPGVGSLQDPFINKLEYEVHKLKGAMEPITWGQGGSSREGHFRDFYFYKKRGYPQDMTPVWNALYDVAQNYNSRFPGSKFGIIQTNTYRYSNQIMKYEFADFKNVDYSQRGTDTIPTKYWIPQPQTLAKLKEKNYNERCNK